MYIFEYRRLRVVGRSRSSGAKRGGRRDLRAGLWLLLEFGVGGRAYAPISYGFAFALMVVVAVRHVQKTKPVRGSLRVSVDA